MKSLTLVSVFAMSLGLTLPAHGSPGSGVISISCDRTHIEDEGPVILNFEGRDGSALKDIELACGFVPNPEKCPSNFYTNVASRPSPLWPLGTYAGVDTRGNSYTVSIDAALSDGDRHAEFLATITEVYVAEGPYISVSEATCYRFER